MQDKHLNLRRELCGFEDRFRREHELYGGHNTGYLALDPRYVLENLEYLLQKNEINPNAKFIDWGSGLAINVVAPASLGFDSYGVEIDELLAEGSNEIIAASNEKELIPSDTVCKVVHGSYFPNEYIDLRDSGNSLAVRYEEAVDRRQSFLEKKVFFPVGNSIDIYEKLGVKFNDFDIFFCFSWGIAVPSLFEIFSLYAKDNAILLLAATGEHINSEQLLIDLNLKKEIQRPYAKTRRTLFTYPLKKITKQLQTKV